MALQSRSWPIRSGTVPALADGFTWRPETRRGPWDALRPGTTTVLGPGDAKSQAGHRHGTGKTQLAAAFAAQLWMADALDLLVWLDAGSRDSIISGYTRALAAIRVAAPSGRPEAAAARFLTWLTRTGRRWLVVLDGLADQADADGLWPVGPGGQVLVTTALADLTPKPPLSATTQDPLPAHQSVAVPALSQREALNYLSARLNDDPYQVAGALDLAIDLDCLPVALSLAVSYLLDSGLDCRQYRLARERYRLVHGDLAASDPLAPTWMLAVDRAGQFAGAELAWPALRLTAALGPARIPAAVLGSAAACGYITGRPAVTAHDQVGLQAAFGNLHRLGLITINPEDETGTVSMPAALQFSVRRAMGQAELHRAVLAAADAVCECWQRQTSADLEQALRDCATGIERCHGLALWTGRCHPLLARVGQSLEDAQMSETAAIRWRHLALRSAEFLGACSPATLHFRDRLANAAAATGRADEAILLREELVTDIDGILGTVDQQAIAARARLARTLRSAGRRNR